MANAIVTFKIMPESPDVDMESVAEQAKKILANHKAKGDVKHKIEPVAFGIKHVYLYAMFETTDEGNDYDAMQAEFAKIEGVADSSLEKIDLAMG